MILISTDRQQGAAGEYLPHLFFIVNATRINSTKLAVLWISLPRI